MTTPEGWAQQDEPGQVTTIQSVQTELLAMGDLLAPAGGPVP